MENTLYVWYEAVLDSRRGIEKETHGMAVEQLYQDLKDEAELRCKLKALMASRQIENGRRVVQRMQKLSLAKAFHVFLSQVVLCIDARGRAAQAAKKSLLRLLGVAFTIYKGQIKSGVRSRQKQVRAVDQHNRPCLEWAWQEWSMLLDNGRQHSMQSAQDFEREQAFAKARADDRMKCQSVATRMLQRLHYEQLSGYFHRFCRVSRILVRANSLESLLKRMAPRLLFRVLLAWSLCVPLLRAERGRDESQGTVAEKLKVKDNYIAYLLGRDEYFRTHAKFPGDLDRSDLHNPPAWESSLNKRLTAEGEEQMRLTGLKVSSVPSHTGLASMRAGAVPRSAQQKTWNAGLSLTRMGDEGESETLTVARTFEARREAEQRRNNSSKTTTAGAPAVAPAAEGKVPSRTVPFGELFMTFHSVMSRTSQKQQPQAEKKPQEPTESRREQHQAIEQASNVEELLHTPFYVPRAPVDTTYGHNHSRIHWTDAITFWQHGEPIGLAKGHTG